MTKQPATMAHYSRNGIDSLRLLSRLKRLDSWGGVMPQEYDVARMMLNWEPLMHWNNAVA